MRLLSDATIISTRDLQPTPDIFDAGHGETPGTPSEIDARTIWLWQEEAPKEDTSQAQEVGLFLPRGHVLCGRYSVLNVKKRGGFGVLYHCIDLSSHEFVLIKELFPSETARRNADHSVVLNSSPTNVQSLRNR